MTPRDVTEGHRGASVSPPESCAAPEEDPRPSCADLSHGGRGDGGGGVVGAGLVFPSFFLFVFSLKGFDNGCHLFGLGLFRA